MASVHIGGEPRGLLEACGLFADDKSSVCREDAIVPFIDIHNKIPKFSNCLFTTLVKLLCDNVNFLLCSVFLLFGYQHSLALP